MKRLLSVNDAMTSAVAGYVDAIEVPAYRAAAVEARRNGRSVEPRDLRRVWLTVATGLAALALVAFAPAVVAQVQRVMQAFTVINGRLAPVPTRQVSLAQLRADMPFAVVRPAYIPRGYEEELDEVGTGSTARAMLHYSLPGRAPAVSIIESSAADRSASQFRVAYRVGGGMPAGTLPVVGAPGATMPQVHVVMKTVRGGVGTVVQVTPITWVTHGTRITVIGRPGALSRMEMNAILRSMR